jgi:alkanesulfonate monooxygenase SsuD/methylene tetrahydromethanopterin reductase-like flavin-dependent oxidoreductase (luciferase family)
MLDEALTGMRSLWTNETKTFEGTHYKLRRDFVAKADSQTLPPVLLGGGGKGLLRCYQRRPLQSLAASLL